MSDPTDHSAEAQLTRDRLADMRPLNFMRGQGPTTDEGKPRTDLGGAFASAACVTFEQGELAPQELGTTYEAIKQCLQISEVKDPGARFRAAVDHALDVIGELLQKEPNDELVDWIYDWFPLIDSDAAIEGFHQHMRAVVTQYTVIAGLKYAQ